MDSFLKGNVIESHAVGAASSNAEDLETILRQGALENLKKFRGASRPSLRKPVLVKGDCGAKANILSVSSIKCKENSKTSAVGHHSGKDANDDVGQSKKELLNVISDTSAGEKKVHVSSPDVERVDSYSSREHQTNAAKGNNDTIDNSTGKLRQDSLPSKKNLLLQKQRSGVNTSISAVSKGISETLHLVSNDTIVRDSPPDIADAPPLDPVNYKGTSVEVFLRRSSKLDKHLGVARNSSVPETLKSQGSEKHDEKSSQTAQPNRIADDAEEISKSTVCTSKNHNTEGQSSNQKENENNDSSQFQQKTMSVMRGGEMVQASYKVYIPKKAPALARRKVRR